MSQKSVSKTIKKQQMQQKSKTTRKLQNLMIITGGLFALALIIISMLPASPKTLDLTYQGHPRLGDANAPVQIAEFGDFKCPSCKIFSDKVFPQLKKDYIDKKEASLTFFNNPIIGPDSTTAGAAGLAVYHQNEQAFWTFYEALYKNQGEESKQWATPAFLLDLAKKEKLQVNLDQLQADLKAGTYEKAVQKEYEFAKNAGITQTPTIFINGKEVSNPFDYNEIKSMIDEASKGTRANAHK